MEIEQAGRADLGKSVGRRTSGLAYRVLGHEHEISGATVRHPWRRAGSDFSASRKRDRTVRSGGWAAIGALLAAQRLFEHQPGEDVEVLGQFLHDPRDSRRLRCRGLASLFSLQPLSKPNGFFCGWTR